MTEVSCRFSISFVTATGSFPAGFDVHFAISTDTVMSDRQ